MRHILRGYTMWLDGADYGLELEELQVPLPREVTQDYRGGGMDLGVAVPMAALEPIEVTFKLTGPNPEVLKRMALAPGERKRFTFRGATVDEIDGATHTNIILVEGRIAEGTPDAWQRGEQAGVEFMVRGVMYLKWTVDDEIVHEIQAWPPKRVIDRVDRTKGISEALGY